MNDNLFRENDGSICNQRTMILKVVEDLQIAVDLNERHYHLAASGLMVELIDSLSSLLEREDEEDELDDEDEDDVLSECRRLSKHRCC